MDMRCTTSVGNVTPGLSSILLVMVISVGFVPNAGGQFATLGGVVKDADSGEPLPGVNVFIDQTTIGAATDNEGAFTIETLLPGSYKLVVSMIGYKIATQQFEVLPSDSVLTTNFSLEPQVLGIGEIEVIDERRRGWKRQLKQFKRLFLGVSSNARRSEILNPYILDFSTERFAFSASATEPIQIENRALGYLITFLLTDFRMEWDAGLLHMQGPYFFTPLEPASEDEMQKWEANRKKAYEGSFRHVLTSLVQRNYYIQGFDVKYDDRIDAPFSREKAKLKPIEGLEFTKPTNLDKVHLISFPRYLFVSFEEQQSWLKMNKNQALVHESGYVYSSSYYDSGAITVYGALSAKRIADLLPRDYVVDNGE